MSFKIWSLVQRKLSAQVKANRMALDALDLSSSCCPALKAVIDVLDEQLRFIVQQLQAVANCIAPSLLGLLGVGPVVASVLLGEVGDVHRFATQDQFATYCGAAPVERGSGKNSRVQLNHGGNRRLNWALHIVALTRSRCDPRTQALLAKLKEKGKTPRASLRILKTYIAREFFRHLKRTIPSACPVLPT